MPTKLLMLVAAIAALATGCRPKCDPSTDVTHCEDNVLKRCPEPGVDQIVGANQWVSKDCETDTCVAAGGDAFCALSATPSSTCADAGERACDGTTEVFCTHGFETTRSACLSCQPQPDGGSILCEGGPLSPCAHDSDCAAPLVCTTGFCRTQDQQ